MVIIHTLGKKYALLKSLFIKKLIIRLILNSGKMLQPAVVVMSVMQKNTLESLWARAPSLVKDRHLFSFKNGNYITKYNISPPGETPIYKDVFVPYGTPHEYINNFSISSKYHDQTFVEFDNLDTDENWFDTIMCKCSTFKNLLDYQEFTVEIQQWLCTFMGRMCFELGDLDNWQVLFYLLGQAGAGKSTILMKILHKFFDDEDVGVIANNIDPKYGIKPHANKKVVFTEISENFKMEQTDWQFIVEGGPVLF